MSTKALEKAQATYDAEMVSAFLEGKDAGIKETTQNIINKMIELKMNEQDILDIMGISFSELQILKRELQK